MKNKTSCPLCKYQYQLQNKKNPKKIDKSISIILKRQEKEIKRMKYLCPSNRKNYMVF